MMSNESAEPQETKPSQEIITLEKPDEPVDVINQKSDEVFKNEFDGMPPEVRREVQAFMGMIRTGSRSGVGVLFEKFNEKHIDKYLDYVQRDDDHAYELSRTNRRYYLAYFLIALFVLGAAVVYLLPRDKTFLESIIQILIILGGGIGAGYGLRRRNDK